MITLSTRVDAVRGSAIRDLLTLTARADILSLAGGLPAADLLPRERIAEAAAVALTDPASVQYGQTAGLARLREVLAEHESRRCGRPVYVGALQVFQAAGAALHAVPLDDDGMQVDVLAERLTAGLRPRIVHTVSSFHNPRGAAMAAGRRRELAALAGRYGFLVVEDDPYALLAFHGAPPVPVAAYGDRVVRLGSASKILAPALRVGWLTGPAEVLAAVERLKQCADLCTSSLTQAIAADLLADAAWFDAHLDRVRTATAARARAFTDAVAELLPQVSCSTPTGGMFCWLEFSDGTDTTALLPRALERGVAFVPGGAFEVEAPLPSSMRCCFASLPADDLREAVRRLATSAP